MALGPQNIFLIRQGALRRHVVLSTLTCFISDAILITASVAGLHHLLELHPAWQAWISALGFLFLMFYGLRSMYYALTVATDLEKKEHSVQGRKQIILLSLGFSLLNPHAIVDSLVLIGGGSTRYPGHQSAFLSGVLTSSLIWFTMLTLTAYYFSEAIRQKHVWKRMEFISGVLMIYLGFKLLN